MSIALDNRPTRARFVVIQLTTDLSVSLQFIADGITELGS